MIYFHLVAVAIGFWCKLLNAYLTTHEYLRCTMNVVLPSIMSKWPQRIVFTDRLSISAQIAVQFIPEDDEKNKSSQFIFFPEILQSWIMIWFVTVSARDLNFAPFTFFPSNKNNTFLCLTFVFKIILQGLNSPLYRPRVSVTCLYIVLSQSFYFELLFVLLYSVRVPILNASILLKVLNTG